jgi:hypothetical protein
MTSVVPAKIWDDAYVPGKAKDGVFLIAISAVKLYAAVD